MQFSWWKFPLRTCFAHFADTFNVGAQHCRRHFSGCCCSRSQKSFLICKLHVFMWRFLINKYFLVSCHVSSERLSTIRIYLLEILFFKLLWRFGIFGRFSWSENARRLERFQNLFLLTAAWGLPPICKKYLLN